VTEEALANLTAVSTELSALAFSEDAAIEAANAVDTAEQVREDTKDVTDRIRKYARCAPCYFPPPLPFPLVTLTRRRIKSGVLLAIVALVLLFAVLAVVFDALRLYKPILMCAPVYASPSRVLTRSECRSPF
jgi:hypothetical protein